MSTESVWEEIDRPGQDAADMAFLTLFFFGGTSLCILTLVIVEVGKHVPVLSRFLMQQPHP